MRFQSSRMTIVGLALAAAACSPSGESRQRSQLGELGGALYGGPGSGDPGPGSGGSGDPGPGSGGGSGSGSGSGGGPGSGSGGDPGSGSGSGSGSGPPPCTHLGVEDWRPAPGELDGRPWTELELPPASAPHRYSWTYSAPGIVARARISPPGFLGTPAYAHRVDYDGEVERCGDGSMIRAWLEPGIYTAEVSFADGRPAQLFTLFAGATIPVAIASPPSTPGGGGSAAPSGGIAALGGEKPADPPGCTSEATYSQIPWDEIPYDKGAFVIEEAAEDNGVLDRAVKVMTSRDRHAFVRSGTVDDAADKLAAAYAAKGSPINVVIEAHGTTSLQSIGNGTGDLSDEGKYLFMKGTKSNNRFIAKLAEGGTHRVARIALLGCCVAAKVRELVDNHLMCDLARGLAPGDATTEVLAFAAKTSSVEPGTFRGGYFTVASKPWGTRGSRIKKGHCDGWRTR